MSTLDIFIEKGRKEGRMEAEAERDFNFVNSLLSTGRVSTAEIARLVSVTEAFILEINASMKLNPLQTIKAKGCPKIGQPLLYKISTLLASQSKTRF